MGAGGSPWGAWVVKPSLAGGPPAALRLPCASAVSVRAVQLPRHLEELNQLEELLKQELPSALPGNAALGIYLGEEELSQPSDPTFYSFYTVKYHNIL